MIEYPLTDVSTVASNSLFNVDALPVEVVLEVAPVKPSVVVKV